MYLITGMHRSGTSITARLFFEAGGDLGNPETFYRGDRWNPDGYFEQPDFHSVNMPLINGVCGKLSYFFLPSEHTILKRGKKFKDKIKNLDQEYKNKIVKETRFCLTMPAWRFYGTNFQKIIINVREPIQVAHSLKKRNHIPLRLGMKLWYEHNKRLLDYVQDIPHTIFNYNDLFSPDHSIKAIEHLFGFFDLKVKAGIIETILKKFVKINMNHNKEKTIKYPKKIEEILNIYKNKGLKY